MSTTPTELDIDKVIESLLEVRGARPGTREEEGAIHDV
jgi:hypothetical protein